MDNTKVCIIIPARLNSTRFPNKPLADIEGKSMIRRVYEKCFISDADFVTVSTEDQLIYDHVIQFGNCDLTPIFDNGTRRVCYTAKKLGKIYDYVINVQGDEPIIDVSFLNLFIDSLRKLNNGNILTGASNLEESQLLDINSVKLVPYYKNNIVETFTRNPFNIMGEIYKHIGIYGFCYTDIEKIFSMEPSKDSISNSLEQLSWIDAGFIIHYIKCKNPGFSVDTIEDLNKIKEIIYKIKNNE